MGRLLTDAVRAQIGRETSYTAPEDLGRAAIRYFALAIGDGNPLRTDVEHARRAGYADVVAPPTLICETNQYMAGSPDPDGYIGHSWDLDVPGTRLLRGGNSYEFFAPVYPFHRITATWRIVDIKERTSSRGAAMLLVTSEAVYTDQDGHRLARNTETIILQEIESGP